MFKIFRRKSNNKYIVVEWKNGKHEISRDFDTKEEALKRLKQLKRNAYNREKNQILKDLCGCSARQAKIDMGL